MIDQNLKTRLRNISASGLKVTEMMPPAGIPTASEAWKHVVSVERVPVASVSQRHADALTEVDRQWFLQALSNSLFDTNSSFLISVAGPGSLELGWTPVRRTDREDIASQLQYLAIHVPDGAAQAAVEASSARCS
jgi:hypothetical protein